MPPATLPALPTELVQHISSLLPALADSLALRSASRELCAKATDARFYARFTMRTTDLSAPSLAALCAIAAHPDLGHRVRKLVLVTCLCDTWDLAQTVDSARLRVVVEPTREGMAPRKTWVDCSDEEVEEARATLGAHRERNAEAERMRAEGRDVGLLEAVFARFKEAAGLEAVALEAGVVAGDGTRLPASMANRWRGESNEDEEEGGGGGESDKRRLWRLMAHDFHVVLGAMARTGTTGVEELSVYGNDRYGGSVVAEELGSALNAVSREQLEAVVAGVRTLAVRVSFGGLRDLGKHRGGVEADGGPADEGSMTPADRAGFAGRVGDFLGMAAGLERLDVLSYTTYSTCDQEEQRAFFQNMAAPIAGGKLRWLRLRGLRARAVDFLGLLEKCAGELEELELHEIWLDEGAWGDVFKLLRLRAAKLQRLTVYRLYEHRSIFITKPDGCDLPWDRRHAPPPYGRAYQMDGRQVREGVEYRVSTSRWKGSPSLMQYRKDKQHLYHF